VDAWGGQGRGADIKINNLNTKGDVNMPIDNKDSWIAHSRDISGKQWYDTKQVMRKLNCSRGTVQRLMDTGGLKPIHLGRTLRFIPEQVDELMARMEKEALAQ